MTEKTSAILIAVAIIVIFVDCAPQNPVELNQDGFPILRGPYLGQKAPGLTPEIFAPGIVSIGFGEGMCNFSPDGNEIYYNVMFSLKSDWKMPIVYSRIENGVWTTPDFVSFTDMDYLQAYAFLSYEGSELYFTSDKPTNNPELKPKYNFWVARRKGNSWEEPVPLPKPINGKGDVSGISISNRGMAYFTLITEEEQAIYRSQYKDGEYSEPERLPDTVNSVKAQFDGVIAPDESYMILPVHNRDDSLGSTDLYVTFRDDDDNWSRLANLGSSVNTKYTESAARISPDGKYIFFPGYLETGNWGSDDLSYTDVINYHTKPGHGSYDIYWVDARFLDQFRPDGFNK